MPQLGAPEVTVEEPLRNLFRITVTYTAVFTAEERNFPEGFADSVALRESDSGETFGGEDYLYLNFPIRTFRPSSEVVHRTRSVELSINQLDTEVGGEEIYAEVHLRRNIDEPSMTARSNPFPLAV
jgi:hypothetical protein